MAAAAIDATNYYDFARTDWQYSYLDEGDVVEVSSIAIKLLSTSSLDSRSSHASAGLCTSSLAYTETAV